MRGFRAVSTATACAAFGVLLTASAGLAAPVPPAATGQTPAELAAQALVTHPGDDYAGREIARYEDTGPLGNPPPPPPPPPPLPPGWIPGFDVSGHQPNVSWPGVLRAGARFVYIKATEGVNYTSPAFKAQYNGAFSAGMIRGAYHFATPNTSPPVNQADYFLAHGGGWSRDGRTLPPVVDLEYNPYGDTCYGMPPPVLDGWIHDFVERIRARIGRYPVIYTSTSWWNKCTGNNPYFAPNCPLWVARYAPAIGALPAGWKTQVSWQYADSGAFPGDQDYFNGGVDQLRRFALG